MAIVCLDTDILIDIIRGGEPLATFLSLTTFGVTSTIITLLELYYGAFKSRRINDIGLVDSLRKDLTFMEISEEDAKLAGKIMAELASKGQRLDFRDVVIGAMCINKGLALLTRNTKHFSRMKEFGLLVSSL